MLDNSIYSKVYCTLLCMLMTCHMAYGQLWTTDNVTVTVQSGATITVEGDIQNQNGGRIDNDGTIDFSGNWIHNSANNCFGTSAGTVVMNGANQSIGGTNATAFNNLTLLGTGTKTLNVNTTVGGAYASPAGVLSLGSRNVNLNSRTLTIANAATTAITRTTGFIVSETPNTPGYGNMLWNIGTNIGTYVFPFGNDVSGHYLPYTMNITTAGAGATGNIMVATYPTTTAATPNNRPLPPPVPSTAAFYWGQENSMNVVDRWWPMTSSNYTTAPVSTLTFTYRDTEWDGSGGSTNTIVEANLGAQRHNGTTNWVWAPAGTDNPSLNTVTIASINSYNVAWTLVEKDAPLPLELLSFSAALNSQKHTQLKWVIASDEGIEEFVIEKSPDGQQFDDMEAMKTTGKQFTHSQTFQTIDYSPFIGNTFYRLRIVKVDGAIIYSPIRVVNYNINSIISVNIFPNPAASTANVQITQLEQSVTLTNLRLEFIDMYGQMVSNQLIDAAKLKDGTTMDISLDNIAPGSYIVRISDGVTTLESVKLMVRK